MIKYRQRDKLGLKNQIKISLDQKRIAMLSSERGWSYRLTGVVSKAYCRQLKKVPTDLRCKNEIPKTMIPTKKIETLSSHGLSSENEQREQESFHVSSYKDTNPIRSGPHPWLYLNSVTSLESPSPIQPHCGSRFTHKFWRYTFSILTEVLGQVFGFYSWIISILN